MSLKYQELLAQARKSSAKMSGSDTGSSRLANLGRSSRGQSRFVDEDDDAKLGGIMGKKRSGKSDLESMSEERDFMSRAFDKVQSNNEMMTAALREQDKAKAMKSTVNNLDGDATSEGDLNFLSSLAQSESSGNSKAERTNKDGRKFAGTLQFGEARLTDARKALGLTFSMEEFKNNPELQEKIGAWHIKDIDKAIAALGDSSKGYNKNGLRAVAHLGGIGGMKKYVKSAGRYNTKDEEGTYLSDYYTKFSKI